MIPTIDLLTQEIEEVKFEGRTYKVEVLDGEEDRINGFID